MAASFLQLVYIILPFSLFIFHLGHDAAAAECATYFCSDMEIRFPFQHHSSASNNNLSCAYPGFDLSCSNSNNTQQTILNLPSAGRFRVSALSYSRQVILVDDPQKCLPKRLLNFSLGGSPFSAPRYQNYTYLNCSTNVTMYGYTHFPCLGEGGDNNNKHNNKVYVGLSSLLTYNIPPPCMKLATIMAPAAVSSFNLLRGEDSIRLKWGFPRCGACERKGGTCGRLKDSASLQVGCSNLPSTTSGLPRAAKYAIILGAGVPGMLCLIGLGCYISSKFKAPHRPIHDDDNSTPQRTVVVTGLDGPTINSYPKIVIGESKRLPMANIGDDNCAICLCEYRAKDVLRSIPGCHHYFHVKCVDEWLKLNATCPLCRTAPGGSASSSLSHSSRLSLSVSSSLSSTVASSTSV